MDFGEYDNRKNRKVESGVPDVCKSEPCMMGIDEAGRGPVLGPMVYGTCYCPIAKSSLLKTIGFADSKTLTEEQRDNLFVKLDAEKANMGWLINILSPNYISNSMLKRNKYNLNSLSHDTAIGLISRVLELGINLTEVYVDTVGDFNSYQAKLKSIFPNIDIVVSKKADSIYPIVSAASICAKVARDKAIKNWKFIEGDLFHQFDYGSGYPGDPKTKQFLSENIDPIFGFPQFVRFGWSTASSILDTKALPVKWSSKKAIENSIKTPVISNFFGVQKQETVKEKSHKFFSERCLKSVKNLF
ncbi:hypothetical protein HELRODRAFT_73260 [Helobdella robusta]|uniref:Ribonuclease n=1 Tax=Helobdella robusta TaxID=6412 RepID=T1G1C2_HELRO|nr:hypothetical protein HELRODRAFT_73260 [Helobdella robusta]ESO09970.1 hypothetical protein HELRODRAFT_73260 [Helobdella robusta]